ncbi:ECF transporter S component [Clostridium grantii]|uniref:Uncharacterized membrane protein n=1 Tax=Clostridium grantii DSM 8605 TaxID=1121316 RepID=A0A1M5WKE4_9CLOT|nr:ECF transporter S component [Clostridium grantii]SHH87898.1 Uncharacterized membrane protein [Clostridium grantii DSM 8605]
MQREINVKAGRKLGTRQITVIGMLSAISIFLGLTGLGFIPLPLVKATILHVPVIIGAIIEGPLVGAIIGLIFGMFSMYQAIVTPTPTSFLFLNPLVAVLPRILIGIGSYYVYRLIPTKKESIKIGFAAAIGSLINTFGVLTMIYVLYAARFAKAINIEPSSAGKFIYGLALTNGIPEAIVSVIITVSIVVAVKKVRK